MDAPAFDPNKPFEESDAPPFGPNKPYDVQHLTGWQRAADIPLSGGIGVVKGAIGMGGMAGDLRELGGAAAKKFGLHPDAGKGIMSSAMSAVPGIGLLNLMSSPPTSADIRGKIEEYTGPLYEPKTKIGEYMQTTGEFLPAAAGGPAGVGRRLLTQTVLPAVVSETAGQLTKGTKAEPWARAAGAIFSPLAVASARRVITPNPISAERAAAREVLAGEGVDALTAGQITGSRKLAYAESMAGTRAQQQEERALQQLSEAANRRIGEAGHDVHEAVQRARPRIGADFDRSTSRMQVHMDRQLGDDMQGISASLLREGYSADQVRRVEAQLHNVQEAFNTTSRPGPWTGAGSGFRWRDPTGGTPRTEMTGTAFHNLVRTGSPLLRTIESGDAAISHYGTQIRNALFDAAERTAHRQGTRPGVGSRQALADFQEARRQWANMRALETASSGAGATAAGGILTPAAVRRAATAREVTDYARGRGDFNEIARASNMLMAPLPNSGTAQRSASQWPSRLIGSGIGAALGTPGGPMGHGIGATLGATLGPAIQGRLMMSRPVQRYLSNQLMPPAAVAPWFPRRNLPLLSVAGQQFLESQRR